MRINMAEPGFEPSYIEVDDVNVHLSPAKTFKKLDVQFPFVGIPTMGTKSIRRPTYSQRENVLELKQTIAFWVPHAPHQHPLYVAKIEMLFEDQQLRKKWIRFRYYATATNHYGRTYNIGVGPQWLENRLLESVGDVDGLVLVHWGSRAYPVLTGSRSICHPVVKLAMNDPRLIKEGAARALQEWQANKQVAYHWNGVKWTDKAAVLIQ